MDNPSEQELIAQTSAVDFETTLARLESAIDAAGLMLFTRIDHAAAAREYGLEMPSATVLIYGHPKGGTPIMRDHPNAALDLPLKLLVRVEAGKTIVVYRPIGRALTAAGVSADQAARLAPAQSCIVAAIAS